jgi:hypothetical protein
VPPIQLAENRSTHPHPVIYCLGDSHVDVFSFVRQMRIMKRTLLDVTCVAGATARGLSHSNSTSGASLVFRTVLSSIDSESCHILFMVGEIDCGYLAWTLSRERETSVVDEIAVSLKNYSDFLDSTVMERFNSVFICGAYPPVLRDNVDWSSGIHVRSQVGATQKQRMELTRYFNHELRKICLSRQLTFVDLSDHLMDRRTNQLRVSLAHPVQTNHHMRLDRVGPLWAKRLKTLGFD